MAAISLILMVQKNFKLPTPQSLGLRFSRVSAETEYHRWPLSILMKWQSFFNFFIMADGDIPSTLRKLETRIFRRFSFPNFSIGSVFPVTLLKFRFNIYVWLRLKHFCMVTFLHLEI